MAQRKKSQTTISEDVKAWANMHVGQTCVVRIGGDDENPEIHTGTINSFDVVGDRVLFDVDGVTVDLGTPPSPDPVS